MNPLSAQDIRSRNIAAPSKAKKGRLATNPAARYEGSQDKFITPRFPNQPALLAQCLTHLRISCAPMPSWSVYLVRVSWMRLFGGMPRTPLHRLRKRSGRVEKPPAMAKSERKA